MIIFHIQSIFFRTTAIKVIFKIQFTQNINKVFFSGFLNLFSSASLCPMSIFISVFNGKTIVMCYSVVHLFLL